MAERTRTLNEGLATAPTFTPHRANVTADDAVAPYTALVGKQLQSQGFQDVIADIKLHADTSGAVVAVLFYSELCGALIPASPAISFTLTASAAVRFRTDGRPFFCHVSSLAGSTKRVDISVAGAQPDD